MDHAKAFFRKRLRPGASVQQRHPSPGGGVFRLLCSCLHAFVPPGGVSFPVAGSSADGPAGSPGEDRHPESPVQSGFRSLRAQQRAERMVVEGYGRKEAAEAEKGAEQHYQKWSKEIGVNGSIESLAKYYDVRYNDSPRYELLKGYAKTVKKGDISPLVGFDRYEEVGAEIQKRIVGTTTSTGITIGSFANHFIDRIIGQTSTPHPGMRCGVSIEDALDALESPIRLGGIRILDDGDIRQTFYGKKARRIREVMGVNSVLNISEQSQQFLEKYLPSALLAQHVNDALDPLFDLIEEKGFAPPHYDEYNDFGREAQRVYDDIYLSSLSEEELERYRIKE